MVPPAAADSRSALPSPSASIDQHQHQHQHHQPESRNRKRPHPPTDYHPPSPSQTPATVKEYPDADADADADADETAAAERTAKAHLAALLRGYCTYASAHQWRTWSEIFAEDAVLTFEYFGQLRGRREIFCGVAGMSHFWYDSTFFSDVHLDLDPRRPDQRATGTANLWYRRPKMSPNAPETPLSPVPVEDDQDEDTTADCDYCGPYEFEFVKAGREWKIKTMSLKVLSDHREDVDRFCTRCDCIPLSTCGTPCHI
ncbi:uncharacterized protein BKCO1_12000159 [Diplodia corticola]|uniref:SnoaL-like domain-containing protein n=1 Tax=Diplodia corticola TaxID=236234 RepID=A0A1J9S8Q2_9PEZI|nr:uncharacterized protein BKCO1_12000159 [Diplodia corticola]OJD36292.1 hypothetical protein BKCO1_12000159 [Diplodia corticola]